MVNTIDIGKRIKEIREESGLTQGRVAEYLHLDQSMVAKMEKGERKITSDVIDKLSALFCCPVDYLIFGENDDKRCSVSFRKTAVEPSDLEAMAIIHKIVMNQMEMDELLEEEDDEYHD